MPPSVDVESLPAMAAAAQKYAFISWEASLGRRACPLATFGSREPQELNVRLACAEPPRADQPELKNEAEVRGAIALVVRGGCNFAHKARLLQKAGAVAMLLANNTRDEPLAAFTMGESRKESANSKKIEEEPITIPCVMMCLRDVRELFQKFPPSVKNGKLCFEILQNNEEADIAEKCLKEQRQRYEATKTGRGWKAIKWTTTSFATTMEPHHIANDSAKDVPSLVDSNRNSEPMSIRSGKNLLNAQEKQQPLLAFVQWATSATTYEICFAPLADFCSASAGASYSGKLVACDPLVADRPLENVEQLTGAVAVLRRGSCSFPEKLARVQRAGAVAAIVCNDDEEDLEAAFVMSVDHIDAANATLPAVMISHKTFLRIQSFLNLTTARILCLAGQMADGVLELNGKSVSFDSLSMPVSRQVPREDRELSIGDNNTASPSDLVFPLHRACRNGDHAACQQVLANTKGKEAKRLLVNRSCPSNGLTALHHACAGGNDNVVEFLLQHGAAPDSLDLAMQTPLHVACANNHINCARLLLRAEALAPQVPAALYNVDEEYGGLPTRRNIGGGTAMHEAARAGSSECVELLLSTNARVEHTRDGASNNYVFLGVSATDLEGNTPLHMACANAHAECGLYLMAASADVDCPNSKGHSPLFLAIEAANDSVKQVEAVQIIKKLIKAGAVVEESDDEENHIKNDKSSGNLLLDRIKSLGLRRDLEILYLRYEAQNAKQKNLELEMYNEKLRKSLDETNDDIRTLQNLVNKHAAYENQIHHLQLQVQMMLQFRANCDKPTLSCKETIVTPLFAEESGPLIVKNDEELALEAALARDLGKKCLRQGQSVLAVKYFQRSLELMPLPGVHRLLVNAQKLEHAKSSETPTDNALGVTAVCSTSTLSASEISPTPPNARAAKIQELAELVRITNTTPQARAMLENELNKLKTLSNDMDFARTCRWTEWLVALPWGDTNSGLQHDDWYALRQNEFLQLDAIDVERDEAHRNQAMRIIQRSFQKCYAVHLRARKVAAVKIQAAIRGKLARLHIGKIKPRRSEAQNKQGIVFANQQKEMKGATLSRLDFTKSIDPSIQKKLPCQYLVKKLIAGKYFLPCKIFKSGCVERGMRIVQLIQCVKATTPIPYKPKSEKEQPLLFVWTRWEEGLDKLCACVLSGPYDNQQDARRRFCHIVCEVETILGEN